MRACRPGLARPAGSQMFGISGLSPGVKPYMTGIGPFLNEFGLDCGAFVALFRRRPAVLCQFRGRFNLRLGRIGLIG